MDWPAGEGAEQVPSVQGSDFTEVETPGSNSIASAATRALLIPAVLEKIAKNMPVKDLITLRQTCAPWNEEFVSQLRLRAKRVILMSVKEPLHDNPGPKHLVSGYANLMKYGLKIPFTKYWIMDGSSLAEEQYPDLDNFFSVCQEVVHTLDVSLGFDPDTEPAPSIDVVRQVIFERATKLSILTISIDGNPLIWRSKKNIRLEKPIPKLKKLTLNSCASGGSLPPAYRYLVSDLMKNAVNLVCLSLSVSSHCELENEPVLQVLRVTASLHILKELDISGVTTSDLQILTALEIRLEKLDISIIHDRNRFTADQLTATLEALHEFLATQSSSLLELKLALVFYLRRDRHIHVDIGPPSAVQLPDMPRLQKFRLLGKGLGKFNIQFEGGRGTMGGAFPQLQRFETDSCELGEGEASAVFINQLIHDGVTHLVLKNFEREELDKFGILFRGVKRLELEFSCDTERLGQIWTTWPGLKALYIKQTSFRQLNLDQLLTGIPTANLDHLRRSIDQFSSMSLEKLRELQNKNKTQPGISDLEQLNEFSLRGMDDVDEQCGFTNIGGYLGVAMASRSLQSIQIKNWTGGGPFLSTKCEALIRNTFGPLVTIDIGRASTNE